MTPGVAELDLAAVRAGGPAAAEFVATLSAACETAGIFGIRNHGIDDTLRASLRGQSEAFFGLDDAVKRQLAVTDGQCSGYISDPAGLYERYRLHLDLDGDDPMVAAGVPLYGTNVWPASMPEFEGVVNHSFDVLSRLSLSILRVLAMALDVDRDVFLPFFDNPLSTLTLTHSPPVSPTGGDQEGSRHSFPDSSALTLVMSDAHGGIEVQRRDGDWTEVPVGGGTVTVIIGNMMEAWSGGRLPSAAYRFVDRGGAESHSLVFSAIPNYGTVIRPLPGFGSNYRPVHVGPYMEAFYRQQS